jgi:hypothetical protein
MTHFKSKLLWLCGSFKPHYLIMLASAVCPLMVFATTPQQPSPTVKTTASISSSVLFPGQSRVSVAELLQTIAAQANEIAQSPAVRQDYQSLLTQHGLKGSELLYADYVRIRIAFEATRAGGLWGITWRITDKQPQSDVIWTQWQTLKSLPASNSPMHTTAAAECDELSALFAFVARRIGLSKRSQVGLLWPTSNHTVAVWMISEPKPTRIIIPTSQIFLDPQQSLDTLFFDAWKQKKIYDYSRQDIVLTATIPADLARYFVTQIKRYGGLSQSELQKLRNLREKRQRQ